MQVIRASVKPHAISLATGEVLALEDAIESWIERDARGVILIRGDEGSGRTTALRHLAAVLPAGDLRGTNVEDVTFIWSTCAEHASATISANISNAVEPSSTELHSRWR